MIEIFKKLKDFYSYNEFCFIKSMLLFLMVCAVNIFRSKMFFNSKTQFLRKINLFYLAGSSGTRMYVYKWKSGYSAARGEELVVYQHYSCETAGSSKKY